METEYTPSAEEIEADEQAQAEVDQDELRSSLATDLGIEDNEDNKGTLDKLVERETKNREMLSKAVGQKIKYRTALQGDKPTEAGKTKPTKPAGKTEEVDPVEAARLAAHEEYEKRDLAEMNHSDDIKAEIQKVANLRNITVREAERDSYVQHLIGEAERQRKVDDAAKNGGKRSQTGTYADTSKAPDPADFNLATEEGRSEYKDAQKAFRDAKTSQ